MPILEICVDDPSGLHAAIAGGADRIELCSALELGGLTPSAALLDEALRSGCPTHMMIRPRAGGFVLDAGEAALMVAEIEFAVALDYDKILSSGGARTAVEGAATLAAMVAAAGDRLSVIAGSGVTAANVARLVAETGVREVHGSASAPGPEPDAATLRLGFATGPRRRTDSRIVAQLRAALQEETA